MRFWLTRYQFLLILVLALPVCPSEDFAMPLDAPASHAAESPAQPSRAEQLGPSCAAGGKASSRSGSAFPASAADARRACVARRWRSSPGSA